MLHIERPVSGFTTDNLRGAFFQAHCSDSPRISPRLAYSLVAQGRLGAFGLITRYSKPSA